MTGLRVALAAFALLAGCLALASPAAADRPLTLRFPTGDTPADETGNIAIIGNTLETCPASAADCADAQDGIGSVLNNNGFVMGYLDDGDPSTDTSSSADLELPPDATVLFAGLYYGARTTRGTGGAPPEDGTVAGRSTVKFRPPGEDDYLTLGPAGTVLDSGTGGVYAGFIDVTDHVEAAGSGTYSVADVQAATGEDRFAGWALVVAYRDTTQPARSLAVFDGLVSVSRGVNTSSTVTGFRTPAAGPVRTTVGAVGYEGDRGATGVSLRLDTEDLTNDTNPADNFYNSTISILDELFSDKSPDFANQLGIDADLVGADRILPNGATSAVIRASSATFVGSDSFYAQVFTFATDLHAPRVEATKTIDNVTNPGGPARPGDTLRYTVTVTNTGQDGASGFEVTDVIPAGAAYTPGSLELLTGPGAPASPSDAGGDDVAEFDAAGDRVVFRLGTGANATEGGLIEAAGTPGDTASFSFDVTVDADTPDGAEIVNRASATFFGQTLGVPLTAETAEVATAVAAPDLTIAKTHTGPLLGGASTPFTLLVSNEGSGDTDGSTVTVTDTFPTTTFASVTVTSTPGWTCNVVATSVTCSRADVLASEDAYPPIQLSAVLVPAPPAQIENTASVAGGADSILTNNSSTDVGPGVVEADLQLTKSARPETVLNGDQVTFTLAVLNGGPSPATGVVLDDPLGPNFRGESAESTQGTCDTTVSCAIGTLAPGAEATVTIVATVVGTGSSHDNIATVTSTSPDPTPGNNSASSTVTVPITADLKLAKTGSPETPDAGDPDGLSYTITVENTGPATANNVHLIDPLPARFTPSSAGGGGFTCNLPPAGGTLVCTRPSLTVAAGPVDITVVGTIALAGGAEVLKNSASVEATQGDPRTDDNTATASNLVIPAADLDLFKAEDKASLRPGDDITYTLTVRNQGPSDALNVTLADTLGGPARTILSVTPSQGSCTTAEPIECALGDLAEAAEATVTIAVRADATGLLTNEAAVTSDTPDPVPANGSSGTVTADVVPIELRLSARDLLVFRELRSGVHCRSIGSSLRSCAVVVRKPGGRVIARGTARAGGAGKNRLAVRLRLTNFGRSLLEDRLGGVRVRVQAKGVSIGGERPSDRERVHAVIDPETFRTPPGAWSPDRAVLTPLGKRFLRNIRDDLIAVRRVVCEGHTARITSALNRPAIALSLARARVVCARLRGFGIHAPQRIVSKGGSEPIATNATEAGRRQNRRVEVILRH
jgi:uncharacterized repeat protein (TIGR01451 family)